MGSRVESLVRWDSNFPCSHEPEEAESCGCPEHCVIKTFEGGGPYLFNLFQDWWCDGKACAGLSCVVWLVGT